MFVTLFKMEWKIDPYIMADWADKSHLFWYKYIDMLGNYNNRNNNEIHSRAKEKEREILVARNTKLKSEQ